MKCCTKCGQVLPLALFKADKRKQDGRAAECKKCRNARSALRYATDEAFRARALERSRNTKRPFNTWSQEERDKANERKRLGRLQALPGYKAARHDAHVDAWRALRPKPVRQKQLELHDAHVKALRSNDAAMHRLRLRVDAGFRLNMRLRVQIRKALKGRKAGRSWEQFVGYSLDDLVAHLSRMLPKRVTLDGALADGWHIDHIVPKSTFNLADEAELKAAWCLSNLRLLPALDNIRKSDRREVLL